MDRDLNPFTPEFTQMYIKTAIVRVLSSRCNAISADYMIQTAYLRAGVQGLSVKLWCVRCWGMFWVKKNPFKDVWTCTCLCTCLSLSNPFHITLKTLLISWLISSSTFCCLNTCLCRFSSIQVIIAALGIGEQLDLAEFLKPFASAPKGFFPSVLLLMFWLLLVGIRLLAIQKSFWLDASGWHRPLFFNWQSAQAPMYCTFGYL